MINKLKSRKSTSFFLLLLSWCIYSCTSQSDRKNVNADTIGTNTSTKMVIDTISAPVNETQQTDSVIIEEPAKELKKETVSIIPFPDTLKKGFAKYEGVWIAEDYYHAFIKSKSAVMCKKAFNADFPAGLRINLKERKDSIINIGFAVLHDHDTYPEVSRFILDGKDTVWEQGCVDINLHETNKLGYVIHQDLGFFNYERKAYMYYNKTDNVICIHHAKTDNIKAKMIRFVQIADTFDIDYQYPNPIYMFTRRAVLEGEYILEKANGDTLSHNLSIDKKGKIKGAAIFKDYIISYSTDVYCGNPQKEDIVRLNKKSEFKYFAIKVFNDRIDLYKREDYNYDTGKYTKGKKLYSLIRK